MSTILELLKRRLAELEEMLGQFVNISDITYYDLTFKRGQISSLLELLECPQTVNEVYGFMFYYANGENQDEFTRSPDQETRKSTFDEWLKVQEKAVV